MLNHSLNDSFIEFCKINKFEINNKQIEIINLLNEFTSSKKNFLSFFLRPKNKMCFYLYGSVGVGKTMLLNFVYEKLKVKKLRVHFNEFMINFHDFIVFSPACSSRDDENNRPFRGGGEGGNVHDLLQDSWHK